MDPDANLEEQRRLAEEILDDESPVDNTKSLRLAELVQALDEWIRAGGFLPGDWKRH